MTVERAVTKSPSGAEPRFAGQVVIVTGAARGVGKCVVERMVDEGGHVLAVDKPGSNLSGTFAALGAMVESVEADLTEHDAPAHAVSRALARFDRLDVVINNAGVTTRAPLKQTTDEIWAAMIDINLRAAFLCCRAAVSALRRAGGGAIVNNASINAIRGNTELSAYSAAKGGLVSLTRALATELASDNIRVNAICPGTIDTPMTDEYLASVADRSAALAGLIRKHPLGRLATPAEVANAIVFLASSDASFITGAVLPVDGGRHLL
jgi:3-oxoacyl-[acyl-carrier protein] reductase